MVSWGFLFSFLLTSPIPFSIVSVEWHENPAEKKTETCQLCFFFSLGETLTLIPRKGNSERIVEEGKGSRVNENENRRNGKEKMRRNLGIPDLERESLK